MTRNNLLRQARVQRHWTQSTLAAQLNTTRMTVVRWEQGKTLPSLYFREQLCQVFHMTEQELGLGLQSSEVERLQVWQVPQVRNHFFTGREAILRYLYTTFWEGQAPATYPVQIISGLAGMGKTQVALEYVYRFEQHYSTIVWLRAGMRETFISDLNRLRMALRLPTGYPEDEAQVEHALQGWLEISNNWLLIFDNLEDFSLISGLLPTHNLSGHILITTRTQATGRFDRQINLGEMDPENGALLFLRRAKFLSTQQNLVNASAELRTLALELSVKLGGFPLALNQAGSYIEETGCSLSGYLERFQSRRSALLSWCGQKSDSYPASVTATLLMAQEEIAHKSLIAREILYMCLFLYHDAIPEKLIIQGSFHLGSLIQSAVADLLKLDEAFAVLNSSALIRRDPEAHRLVMHSLIQTVLRDEMEIKTQYQWIERILHALHYLFPAHPRYEVVVWPFCELLLPHVLRCIEHVEHMVQGERWISIANIGSALILRVADYLLERTRYQEAEGLLKRALDLFTPDSRSTSLQKQVAVLHTLALLYERLGRYREAEILVHEILSIQRRTLAENDPQIGGSLHLLVLLHSKLGQYPSADQFAHQALLIYQQAGEEKNLEFADFLQTLAQLNIWTGQYQTAVSWASRSLKILEKALGPEEPALARVVHIMAIAFWEQGEYQTAGELFQQIFLISERTLGSDHPFISYSLYNRALLYKIQGEYEQAEERFLRILELWDGAFGSAHLERVDPLKNLSEIYLLQQRYVDAENMVQCALKIYQQGPGIGHPQVAVLLCILAVIAAEQNFYEKARDLYQQAFLLCKQFLDQEHPYLACALHGLARLYMKQEMYEQAGPLFQQALDIRMRKLGVSHPDTRLSHKFYCSVLAAQQNEQQDHTEVL